MLKLMDNLLIAKLNGDANIIINTGFTIRRRDGNVRVKVHVTVTVPVLNIGGLQCRNRNVKDEKPKISSKP